MWTRIVSWCSRLGFAWARRRVDDETRREFEMHLELLAERYVARGLTPDEARAAARRQFGNVTLHREHIHETNGLPLVDGLTQDVRYALRQLAHAPGFFAVVIVTLALGIGGTTAVFSVMHAVILAPLPYAEPGRLVRIYQQEPGQPATRRVMSVPQFRMLRDEAASFADVGARYVREDLGLDLSRDGGGGQRLRTLLVSSDYFRVLHTPSFRGPGFQLDDEQGLSGGEDRTGAKRVVLSDAAWRQWFNADPSLIGTTIRLSAVPYEVAGIAPPGFQDPLVGAVDAWAPYDLAGDTHPENNTLAAFGRLRPGVSLEQALSELAVLSESAKSRWTARASGIVAVPLQRDVASPSRSLIQLLAIAVALVLLVACVNVANLVLVRSTGRVQEFAVRAALGSSRSRLARQLMIESLIPAALGGLAGLALAALGVDLLRTLGRDAVPRLESVGFNAVVLAFAAVVTIGTALACGVVPALRLAKVDPNGALKQQSRSSTGTRRQGAVRSGLAAVQLALALALLAGAGVLSVSFYRIAAVDLGFRVDGVLTFDVALPAVRYDPPRRAAFQEALADRLSAIPGVIASGGTSRLPATGTFHPWPLHIESGPLAGTRVPQAQDPQHRTVSGNFFEALAIPVLAGRTFDDRDDASAPMRAVVSANLARTAFPGMPFERVVGQRIAVLGRKNVREIIGVVGDVMIDVYGHPTAAVYSAHRQYAANRNWALTQVVATVDRPERMLAEVRAAVAALDPELVVHRAVPMSDVVGRGSRREQFALVLMGTFAIVSLTLAAIGLYGVLAYTVRQRTPEIGIRMALGATAADVRMLVLRQAAVVIGVGLVTGTAGALALGRWLSTLVFQVNPSDPRILVVTAVLLTITAAAAAWLPARRASLVTPTEALHLTSK